MKHPALMAALILPVSACAPALQSAHDEVIDPKPIVEVHNGSAADVDIYAVRGSMFLRLGTVAAQQTARLRLPSAYLGMAGIKVEARALSLDQFFRSDEIILDPGNRVVLQLLDPLPRASLTLFAPR